jgi:hypothetical protein
MPRKSDKKMRDDANYARLNAHLERAAKREEKCGVRCWGDVTRNDDNAAA